MIGWQQEYSEHDYSVNVNNIKFTKTAKNKY